MTGNALGQLSSSGGKLRETVSGKEGSRAFLNALRAAKPRAAACSTVTAWRCAA